MAHARRFRVLQVLECASLLSQALRLQLAADECGAILFSARHRLPRISVAAYAQAVYGSIAIEADGGGRCIHARRRCTMEPTTLAHAAGISLERVTAFEGGGLVLSNSEMAKLERVLGFRADGLLPGEIGASERDLASLTE